MTLAYFDCFSGISGDMALGALVHLGVPVEWLQQTVAQLPLEGFRLHARKVTRSGIEAVRLEVETATSHHHRSFSHIAALLRDSGLPEKVKSGCLAVFDRLAEAESKVHGCTKDEVHFHEVGAIDALVDIVGTALALSYLGVEKVAASALPLGSGTVFCAHGALPVPAPAVVELLKGVPVCGGSAQEELVTPTGAAILVGLQAAFGPMPQLRIRAAGYGAGARERTTPPNLLRVILADDQGEQRSDGPERLVLLECCIDDMNPEIFGYLMERLFEEGALDVYWVPVQMKKNRPGTLVNVLCTPERREPLTARILSETTTLGVRFHEVQRTALDRQLIEVQSAYGLVLVKKVEGLDGRVRLVPEYDACRRIALERSLPLRQVYEAVLHAASSLETAPRKDCMKLNNQ